MCPTPDSTLADPHQINADLQRQLVECRAERDEALARETAMAEVLQVINSSPGDLHHTVIGTSDRVLPGRIVDPACRTAAKDLTRRAYRRLAKVRIRRISRLFSCASAKVPYLNRHRPLSLRGGNRSSCRVARRTLTSGRSQIRT